MCVIQASRNCYHCFIFDCNVFLDIKINRLVGFPPQDQLCKKLYAEEGKIELDYCVLETIGCILINICHQHHLMLNAYSAYDLKSYNVLHNCKQKTFVHLVFKWSICTLHSRASLNTAVRIVILKICFVLLLEHI